MRFSTVAGIFAAMLTLVPALVFAEPVVDDSKKPGYLFVLSATSGSSKGDTLTLNGVPNAVYFSDRPARIAGHMSLSAFIEMWDKGGDSFEADPPNATLSLLEKDESRNIVVEISNPLVGEGSISFKARVLEGELVGSFGPSALFIDMIDPEFGLRPAREIITSAAQKILGAGDTEDP